MTDTIYTGQTPNHDQADAGPTTRSIGMRFTCRDVAIEVTSGRSWVPSTGLAATAWWQLWDVTGAPSLLVEVDLHTLPAPTPSAWMAVPLASPVALVKGRTYVVTLFCSAGTDHYVFSTGGTLPISSGGAIIADTAIFRENGTQAQAPNDATFTNGLFFADVDAVQIYASLFGTATPPPLDFNDNSEDTYCFKTRMQFNVAGTIRGVRLFAALNPIGTVPDAAVYSTSGGAPLTSQAFGSVTPATWNGVILAAPQSVGAGDQRDIVVGPLDRYAAKLAALPVTNGDLTGVEGGYIVSAVLAYPTTVGTTWYGVDVLFEPDTTVAVATAFESDEAQPIAVAVVVATAFESDDAQPVAVAVNVASATESDTAQPVVAAINVAAATESDQAQQVLSAVAVATAFESDQAQALSAAVNVATAFESDIARALVPLVAVPVATAFESDDAVPVLVGPLNEPKLATYPWAILKLLRDCLCNKLFDTLAGPVCRCSLMAGDTAIADICEKSDTGNGQAWVRVTRIFATREFPRPLLDTFTCGGSFWALEVELGVLRCAITFDEEGQPPDAEELNVETAVVLDDAFALRFAAECCLPTAIPSIAGEWQPMSGGGCTGGRITMLIELVPGPIPTAPAIALPM